MIHLGATFLVMGLSQLTYQVWLWLEYGVWHGLSVLTLFRQLGLGEPGFGWGLMRTMVDLLLAAEVSLALIAVGTYLVLARPIAAVINEISMQRRLARTRREIHARRGSAA